MYSPFQLHKGKINYHPIITYFYAVLSQCFAVVNARFPRTRMNVTKLTQAHVQPFLLFITEAFEMRNDKVFHCDGHKSINAG